MIDHVGLNVSDYRRSKDFYTKALGPIGYEIVMDFEDWGTGFGAAGKPDFWVARRDPVGFTHVAFSTDDRAVVDAFYQAAIDAGGADNGPPGLRPDYHEHYYAAFVHDPDGNNVEVVCHKAPA